MKTKKEIAKKNVKKEVIWHWEDLSMLLFALIYCIITFPLWIREVRYYVK